MTEGHEKEDEIALVGLHCESVLFNVVESTHFFALSHQLHPDCLEQDMQSVPVHALNDSLYIVEIKNNRIHSIIIPIYIY